MRCAGFREEGVSEVVGEMILIAIVLILVSLVGISIYGLLPAQREPYVDVLFRNDTGNVYFHHRGGDAIPKRDLSVVVGGTRYGPGEFRLLDLDGSEITDPDGLFDLGCRIEKGGLALKAGDRVQLVTSRAVIFTGVIG